MNIPKFSIIIPVYNVEKYLSKCIKNLLLQTYSNFEIILVDDGSPDNSPVLCDEYAKKDSRIKVIHQKNQGVSCARNNGIKIAKGEWILFCDSDDWLDVNTLEKAIIEINENQYDLIQFGFRYVYPSKEKIIKPFTNDYNKNITYLHFCSMILRKDFLVNNNISFPENITLAEDWYFKYKVYSLNPRVKVVNYISYNYFINKDSVFNNVSNKNIEDEIIIITKACDIPSKYNKALKLIKIASKDKILCKQKKIKKCFKTFSDVNLSFIFWIMKKSIYILITKFISIVRYK